MSLLQSKNIFAGRYTLLEKLGIGGYSEVWKATDNMAGEMLVALKIFAPDKGLDQNGIQVFSKEYGLVFNLNHPNLLKPSHYDIWEGSPYLVMPYCRNGSVYGKLGEMSETEVLQFIQQAASALKYLHNLPTPIIHQDIKPDNFLIDDNGNFLLSDFGISSRLRRTLTRSVGQATSAGTLAYMPPERFGREQQILPASDIFSLGVTVFELLTERQPFGEHGGLLLKNGADIPDLPQKFSSGLNALVRSCLNADPALRPDAKLLKIKAAELTDSLKIGTSPSSLLAKPLTEVRNTVQIPILASPLVTDIPVNNKDGNYWYLIVGILLLVGLILIIVFNQTDTTQQGKIANAVADSTVLANSLVNAVIEQNRIMDSLSLVDSLARIQVVDQAILNPKEEESVVEQRIAELKDHIVLKPKSDSHIVEQSIPSLKDEPMSPRTEVPQAKTGLSIGQKYAGGIIFYIDDSGQHGLTCSPWDQSSSICWHNGSDFLTNASGLRVGEGKYNTDRIVISQGLGSYAATICTRFILSDYNDWYLPSKEELKLMYINLKCNRIGAFTNAAYWSSSENGKSMAFYLDFGDGYQGIVSKSGEYRVRAIRDF